MHQRLLTGLAVVVTLAPASALAQDWLQRNDAPLQDTFPYLATPWSGYRGGTLRNTPCANLDRGGNDSN